MTENEQLRNRNRYLEKTQKEFNAKFETIIGKIGEGSPQSSYVTESSASDVGHEGGESASGRIDFVLINHLKERCLNAETQLMDS